MCPVHRERAALLSCRCRAGNGPGPSHLNRAQRVREAHPPRLNRSIAYLAGNDRSARAAIVRISIQGLAASPSPEETRNQPCSKQLRARTPSYPLLSLNNSSTQSSVGNQDCQNAPSLSLRRKFRSALYLFRPSCWCRLPTPVQFGLAPPVRPSSRVTSSASAVPGPDAGSSRRKRLRVRVTALSQELH